LDFQLFGFPALFPLLRSTRLPCILIMPAPTSHLATAFAVDGPRGTDFFNSIDPPGKVDTLHATLLDGSTKTPAMGDISQSFGHRVSRAIQQDLKVPDVFLSGQKRIDYGTSGFDKLNDPQVVGTARMQALQDYPIGAVLLVSSGGTGDPYITLVANPSITPVDLNSQDGTDGAPLWETAFESHVVKPFVAAANTPTHGVLSSGSWKTRAAPCTTREGLIKLSHPVMLTPGSHFGKRSPTGVTFLVLLWPELIDPPVGLFWPVSTTFDAFLTSLDKVKPYAAFVELCKQRKDIVQEWFRQVHLDWKALEIGMFDASPLLKSLPTTSNPAGTDVANLDALHPFQLQLDRYLWALHCDRLLRSTHLGKAIDRQAFQAFLKHGHLCYPAGLCHSKAPPTHQAFFGYLLKPEMEWPDTDLTLFFRQLDKDGEVPNEILSFAPMEIVIMPTRQFTPVRMTKTAVSDWSAYAALLHQRDKAATPGATHGTVTVPQPLSLPAAGPTLGGPSVTPSPTVVVPSLRQRLPPIVPPTMATVSHSVYDVDNGVVESAPSTDAHRSRLLGLPPPASMFQAPPLAPLSGPPPALYSPPAPGLDARSPHGLAWETAPRRTLFGSALGGMNPVIQLATMMEASLIPANIRSRSPAVFLDLCFLLGHEMKMPGETLVHQDGNTLVEATAVILLRQPCQEARQILQVMSTSKETCDPLHSFLRGRLLEQTMAASTPTAGNLSFCTQGFVSRAFTVSRWDVSVNAPPAISDSSQFSPLCFNLAVNPAYSTTRIPAGGYSRPEAGVLGETMYLFYSCLDLKYDHTGVTDHCFRQSLFGSFLHYLSQIPFMRQVEEVWQRHPEHCSLIWMLQIVELFQIFNELISLRRLSSTGGIEEVRVLSTNRTYVVGSSQVRGDFMNTKGILTVNLNRLRTQVQTVWIQHAARPLDHFWTTPYRRDFFSGYTAPILDHVDPGQGQDQTTRDPKRGRPKTAFTAAQPPMVFPVLTRGDNPYGTLRDARQQTWPKMSDPQGKQRHMCFSSLFAPPFNQCKHPEMCGLGFQRRRMASKPAALSRIHIDLADPQWSSQAYPESNWDPLIQFINHNSDLLQPSPALKKLTPKAKWK
jgi:hypothetical protein